mmetsp:Transcript_7395/g.22866  ORF Transcript_7395/g.22866 Transcript_7395/m.22866 type:complete len:114 (-) Transcript_7395:487-828(-)
MLTCGEKLKQISVTCLNTPLYMSTPQHVLSRAELCSQMLDAPSLPFQHFVHHGYIRSPLARNSFKCLPCAKSFLLRFSPKMAFSFEFHAQLVELDTRSVSWAGKQLNRELLAG